MPEGVANRRESPDLTRRSGTGAMPVPLRRWCAMAQTLIGSASAIEVRWRTSQRLV